MWGVRGGVVVLAWVRAVWGPFPGLELRNFGRIIGIMILGGAAFSARGLLIGCAINPQQIGLMFSSIISPMIFFGCTYYPWSSLDRVPFMKWAVLINPLVYVAEGMRGALTPTAPHMDLFVVSVALSALLLIFWHFGRLAFLKRASG